MTLFSSATGYSFGSCGFCFHQSEPKYFVNNLKSTYLIVIKFKLGTQCGDVAYFCHMCTGSFIFYAVENDTFLLDSGLFFWVLWILNPPITTEIFCQRPTETLSTVVRTHIFSTHGLTIIYLFACDFKRRRI